MAKIGINMVTGAVKQEEVIIGIDLGTTNSLSAYIHPNSKEPTAINYSGLGTIVPSIVHFFWRPCAISSVMVKVQLS